MTLQALSLLHEEHRWIGRMLDCLDRLIEDGRSRGRLDARAAVELLALFEHFADGVHQRHEEEGLFPRLLARARSVEERVALGRLCGQHEEERRALRAMAERLLGAIYGRERDLQGFLRQGHVFERLHRQHLLQEDMQLLPLAEHLLAEEDDPALLAKFRDLDGEGPDPASVGWRIRSLCEQLGVGAQSASEH